MNWERVVGGTMAGAPILFVLVAMFIDQGAIVGMMILAGVLIMVGLGTAGMGLIIKGEEKARGQRTD